MTPQIADRMLKWIEQNVAKNKTTNLRSRKIPGGGGVRTASGLVPF
jgi:hypothetical protein